MHCRSTSRRTSLVLALALCVPALVSAQDAVPLPATAEAAAGELRTLYFHQDFPGAAPLAAAWLERWPEDVELRLWTVTNWARAGRSDEALALAEALVSEHPADVRSHVAHAFGIRYTAERGEDEWKDLSLAAAERALELAPTDPLAVWIKSFVLFAQNEYETAIEFLDERIPEVDPWVELVVVKANALAMLRYDDAYGPEAFDEALGIFEKARDLDPENLDAHFFPGSYLVGARRVEEAIPLLERSLEISPLAPGIHQSYWRALALRRDLTSEEKEGLIAASVDRLLEARADNPVTLYTLTSGLEQAGMEERKTEVEERILAGYPRSEEAEWVLINRARDVRRRLAGGEETDTAALQAEVRRRYWALLDRKPWAMESVVPSEAYRSLFSSYAGDDDSDPDTLIMVAEGVAEYERLNPAMQARAALTLADRGVGLELADRMARAGIGQVEEYMDLRAAMYEPDEAERVQEYMTAMMHDAIGWTAWKAGQRDTALAHLERAVELNEKSSGIHYHLGQIAEAEGRIEQAELHYIRGRGHDTAIRSDKKNDEALAALYERRHGSMDGYEAYIEALNEKDDTRRRAAVLEDRLEEPRAAAAFRLATLDGDSVGSEILDGKVGVINFWGVWCAPCVAEAPQLQEFHERFVDHPDVVFLSIDNDPDPEKVQTWVARNGITYPVLLDDGYVSEVGVHAFPTTWFLDRGGRIVYEHRGASGVVLEEFTWRVEDLLAEEAGPEGS